MLTVFNTAKEAARTVWTADWAPRRKKSRGESHATPAPSGAPLRPFAKNVMKKGSFSSFMMGAQARANAQIMERAKQASSASVEDAEDELEVYLALDSSNIDMDLDVGAWWVENKDKFPNLFRMARQFFCCPATTAECERVFSHAGRCHDDYKKNTCEETLSLVTYVGVNLKKRRRNGGSFF